VQSKATTKEDYLNELPEDRREAISTIRDKILENLRTSGRPPGSHFNN